MNRFHSIFFLLLLVSFSNAEVIKTVILDIPGTLNTKLTVSEKISVTNLTITGTIDARDFKYLRDEMTVLSYLNLSSVSINPYSGNQGTYPSSWGAATYPANGIPQYSFYSNDTGAGKISLKVIVLPSSLTSIGDMAFQYCSGLTECTIPNSVKTIGNNAFYSCNSLKNISIPDEVTTVGSSAFQFCHGIKSVSIGKKVNSIGAQCFLQCDSLKIVYSNNSVPPTLGGYVFRETFLTMVFVPQGSVLAYKGAIGWSDFNIGTNVLISVNNQTAGGLRSTLLSEIGNEPLSSVTRLKVTGNLNSSDIRLMRDELSLLELDLSEATLEGNVLPAGSFQGHRILTSVKLPDSLVSIGDNAFNSCANLACNVPLPSGLTNIGNYAFLNCKLMTGALNFPENLVNIGNSAFQGCKSLSGPVTIPEKVVTIGESAFSGCTGLTGSLKIPNSVTSIGSYAFKECRNLTGELILSNQLTKISSGTFASCSGLSGRLLIPLYVTTIEGSAFSGCNMFTEVVLSKNTTSIGGQAFYGCSSIMKLFVPALSPPVIAASTFDYVDKSNCVLEVTSNKSIYKSTDYWKLFKTIEEVNATNNIVLDLGLSGRVMESGVVLSNGSILPVDRYTTKSFTIVPDEYYIVDSLIYNASNVMDKLVNNQFTTPPVTTDNTLKIRFKRPYGITVQVNVGGTVTENSVNLTNGDIVTAFKDDVKTFTILPDAEHYLDSLYYGDQNVKSQLTNNKYTTPPVNDAKTLKVVFRKISYNVVISIGSGGILKDNDRELKNDTVIKADINTVKTFSVIPSDGYLLDTLYYNNTNMTGQVINNQFTTPKIVNNNSLRVVFRKIFRITIQKNSGGIVKLNNVSLPNDTVLILNKDDVRTFTILPDDDYFVDSLLYRGTDVKSQLINDQYAIQPVSENAFLKVVFKKYTYNLLIVTGNGGVVKENTTILNNNTLIEAEKNSSKIFTIIPSEGYVLDSLLFGRTDVKDQLIDNQFNTGPVTQNDTLLVRFVISPDTFKLNIYCGDNGYVKVNDVIIREDTVLVAKINAIKTFVFYPAEGYKVDSLSFGGYDVKSELSSNNQYVTPLIQANDTLKVAFKKQKYTISIQSGVGGVVKEHEILVKDSLLAEYGTTKTFSFVPDTGYELASVKFNEVNQPMPSNNEFTTPVIIANASLYVTFRKITYSIFIQAGIGGLVTENNDTLINGDTINAEYGTTKTITIIPDRGYEIDTLTYKGVDVKSQLTNDNKYTTPVIDSDAAVVVTYRKKVYAINLESGVGGAIKLVDSIVSGTVSAIAGTTRTFTFEPEALYRIDSVFFNNLDVKTVVINNQYTTPAIYSNSSLRVVFKKITYSITVQTGAGGEVKENNLILTNGSVITSDVNTTRTFTFVPTSGYELASLVYGGVDVKSNVINNQYTTQPITKNATLIVTFGPKSTDKFDIRVNIGSGGIVKENNTTLRNDTVINVTLGSTKTFTFIPNPGYRVASLTYGGFPQMALITNNTYTTTPITYSAILSVTFEPIPPTYILTILSAEGGVVKENDVVLPNGSKISAEGNTRRTFAIVPDDGYEIEKIVFGGINYTGLVKYQFTTPFIQSNSSLEVLFKLTTAVLAIDVSKIDVHTTRSEIIIEGVPENEQIRIYSLNGVLIFNQKSNGERMAIPVRPDAVYLVNVAGKTYKVIL